MDSISKRIEVRQGREVCIREHTGVHTNILNTCSLHTHIQKYTQAHIIQDIYTNAHTYPYTHKQILYLKLTNTLYK